MLHNSFASSRDIVTEMKVPKKSSLQKKLQKGVKKEETDNLLEKHKIEEAVETSKEAAEEENSVESPVVSDADDEVIIRNHYLRNQS